MSKTVNEIYKDWKDAERKEETLYRQLEDARVNRVRTLDNLQTVLGGEVFTHMAENPYLRTYHSYKLQMVIEEFLIQRHGIYAESAEWMASDAIDRAYEIAEFAGMDWAGEYYAAMK